MKAVILAGGLGTRISEETALKPKPMVEIGGKPILWHIMKIYSAHGINEFVVCLGYKGYMIKEYFANYFLHMFDVTIVMTHNKMEVLQNSAEPWRITMVDTGESTMTGGRLKRVRQYLGDEDFCFTYGDGVGSVNIASLVQFHKAQGTLATLTATQPPGRFGALNMDQHKITSFMEKPQGDGGWINGGFFVLSPRVIDYVASDSTIWEREPMERLAAEGQMSAPFPTDPPVSPKHRSARISERRFVVKPTNLYGPGGNYDLENSYVFPALIRKMHEARVAAQSSALSPQS